MNANKMFLAMMLVLTAYLGMAQEKETEPVKPVLLVMDIQQAFLPYMDEQDVKRGREVTNAVIAAFRKAELPIIRIYHESPEWGVTPGNPSFQFPDDIAIKDSDPQLIKRHASAFQDTELEKMLRDRGSNTVFLCGLSATGCVLATYFGAMERDFQVFMVEGALISPDAEQTRTIESICQSVGYAPLKLIVQQSAR